MRHKLDDRYFQNIDSPTKAYWLGFLYADGYVATKAPWITVCQIKDKEHLRTLKDDVGFTGQIALPRQSGGYINSSQMGRLTISRKAMCQDLAAHGVATHSKRIVETTYEPSYWRGIFDGDGCIHISQRMQTLNGKQYGPYLKASCYIVLQKSDIDKFTRLLTSMGIKYQIQDSKTDNMKYVRFASITSILKFGTWLYSEPGPYLERKYKKFKQLRSLRQATAVE